MSEAPEARFRFGQYEADLRSGELRRNGQIVRLQEQPFQVLAALLQHAGQVVSREELRERLWPGESFGDFDQGLNTAINKLRETLGDSAANPRFIETLPKRGYRFTCPIQEGTAAARVDAVPLTPKPARMRKLFPAVAAMLTVAAGVLAIALIFRPRLVPELPLRKFAVRLPLVNNSTPDAQLLAVSPNGRHIAVVVDEAPAKLWIQDLDRQQPRTLEGSEGALAPFWSPDSNTIGFAALGKVKTVSVQGGPVITVCEMPPGTYISGGSWSPDSRTIAFTAGVPTALYTVPAAGGSARLLASAQMLEERRPDAPRAGGVSGWISQPHFLPVAGGASRVLFTYFAEVPYIVILDVNTGQLRILGSGRDPSWAPTGHLLYRWGNDLWARPFSPGDGRFTAEAFQVAPNAADPSVASDGTLVFRDAIVEQLVWVDRSGARIRPAGQPADGIYYPALSPDGRRVAAEILENGNQDIWVSDVLREARIRLTSHLGLEVLPVWSPATGEVAFSSYRSGNTDIFARRADAGSQETRLTSAPQNERVSDWSQDGQYIVYSLLHPKNGSDLWYLKRNADSKWQPHPLLQTPFNENAPKLSPDGRYVAYLSNDSGRDELYVRQFPSGDRIWPVSGRGASQIRWSRNGRELFYVEAGTLVAVSVGTVPEFTPGAAARLFAHPAFHSWTDANYDISADGNRIILPERLAAREPMIQVVQNWIAEFRGRR